MPVRRDLFTGRPCWILENSEICITLLESGGHIAQMLLKQGPLINPLWVQRRPTIDSDLFNPVLHGPIYGNTPQAKLMSGLAGHNLCFPFWGNPSVSEQRAGMTFHGETNIVRWQKEQSSEDSIVMSAVLPNSQLRFRRCLRCSGSTLHVESSAENLSAWDRPVAWCEHVTFGPPFLEPGITRFEASVTSGFRIPDETKSSFWPEGQGEGAYDLSVMSSTRHPSLLNSFLVEGYGSRESRGRFSAIHPGYGLQVEYFFPRTQFPWLNIWEHYDSQMVTRGMEFSNTPRHGTMKELVRTPTVWNTPAYEWLDAKGELSKEFEVVLTGIEEPWGGTAMSR